MHTYHSKLKRKDIKLKGNEKQLVINNFNIKDPDDNKQAYYHTDMK